MALLAFWKGDWRARAIAVSQVALSGVAYCVCHTWQCWGPGRPPLIAWRGVGEDGVTLVLCLACAWRAERYWVLWASSLALLNVVTDLMGVVVPRVTDWAWVYASVTWTYLVEASVLVGVWQARARAPVAA